MVKWVLIFVLSVLGMSVSVQAQEENHEQTVEPDFVFQTDSLVGLAKSFLGVPYRYGGMTPEGFDCSGFVKYVYSSFGFDVPRSSVELADYGIEIPIDSCHKGDIIIFAGSNAQKRPVGHAGIVVSDVNEPLKFIHSATSNKRGIVITAFDAFDYYKTRFVKVIRVLNPLELGSEKP